MARVVRLVLIPVLFGLTVLLVVSQLQPPPPEPEIPPVELAQVVVVTCDVEPRTMITPEMIEVRDVPVGLIPVGAVQSVEQVLGAIAVVRLGEGEILLSARVGGQDQPGMLSYVLPAGMRAMTVGIDEVVGLAGHLRPGDRVDVVWTGEDPVTEEQMSAIVLMDLLVLAVTQDRDEMMVDQEIDWRDYTSVTLEVTPGDAARLLLADSTGNIRLALRSAVSGPERIAARAMVSDLGTEPVEEFVVRQQVRLYAWIMAVDRDRLNPVVGDFEAGLRVLELPGSVADRLIGMDESSSVLLDRADLIVMSGDSAEYVVARPDGDDTGLWLTARAFAYAEPFLDLDIYLVVRSGGEDGFLRTARAVVRFDYDEVVVICGAIPADAGELWQLLGMDEDSQGKELVIVLKPEHDYR